MRNAILRLSILRFSFGFLVGGLVFSFIGLLIKGEHMSNSDVVLVGFSVSFVIAVAWVLMGLLMQGVTRARK